jgi:Na+/glutamate symporter
MNHINSIALNLMSLALGSLRGLSLGDVALIIAWTLIMIVYVAGQAWRFPGKHRSKN